MPHILAGGAGGFWKAGVHLKTTGYTSKMLSTLVSAAGVRKANGDLVDNFGDPSSTGILTDVIA